MISATVLVARVPVTVSADSPEALADALESVGAGDELVAHLRALKAPVKRSK